MYTQSKKLTHKVSRLLLDRKIWIMNKKQKIILGIALVIIGLMVVFPQIVMFHNIDRPIDGPLRKAAQYMQIITIEYGFILRDYANVNYTVLAFRCFIVGIVTGLLIYAFRNNQAIMHK